MDGSNAAPLNPSKPGFPFWLLAFRSNEVRLWLSVLAYNLGNLWRRLVLSTSFFSDVKTHGILRNKDAPEIPRPPGFPNQTDVLVNGLGGYAIEFDPGTGLGSFPMKVPILLILGVHPDKRRGEYPMTFQQIQLSHGSEAVPGVRGYHQARPQVGECSRGNELAVNLRERAPAVSAHPPASRSSVRSRLGPASSLRGLFRLPGRASADYAIFELKRELSGGRERTAWNPVRSIPTKDFEFSAAEESRIRSVVETGDSYGAGSDRGWLERILAARWPAGNLNCLPVGRSYRVSS
jgi:hypothetical protein